MQKLTLSDVNKKQLRILGFLLVSGGLGYVLATYVANNPALTAIFAPAINYVLYILKTEIDKEGYIEALKERK